MPGMPTDGVPEPEPEPLHPGPHLSRYQMKHLKLVMVGDCGVGKTSLLTTKMSGQFPEMGQMYPMDRCIDYLLVDGQPVSLEMLDTA